MRNLNGLKLVVALTAISGIANADINIDSQVIPAVDITSISILPSSGDLNIITAPGYTVTRNSTTSSNVAIIAFSASPSTIIEGGSTTLSWTTANAILCAPTGGTVEWRALTVGPASGSTNITIATAGSYTFTLSCDGQTTGDTDTLNAPVTVNTPPPPSVPGSCGTPSLAGTTELWSSFFSVSFPLPVYANVIDSIQSAAYRAYEFNTGNVVDDGSLATVSVVGTTGVRLGAISECPGDFNVAPECDQKWGTGGSIRWATNGKTGACQLQPDTTYYFNLTFTDGSDPDSSTCSGSACTVKIRAKNY